jgi:NuA3 HAT complex component NTO1
MPFAQELADVISTGIKTEPEAVEDSEYSFDGADKNPFSDIRERRKLGKRILKAIQPMLETALRIESEITNKPLDSLQKELETIFEASVEARQQVTTAQQPDRDEGGDTIMVDAVDRSEITVKSNHVQAENGTVVQDDVMDTTEDNEQDEGGNIEVNTSGLGIVGVSIDVAVDGDKTKSIVVDGVASSETPPASNGYISIPGPQQPAPPTPPQSNGSLGQEPVDPLTEGGVLWYLKGYKPEGTSIMGEHWTGRDAVRMLSEDLTDMDDEELKGLGVDVDDSVAAVGALEPEDASADTVGPTSKAKASKTRKRRASGRRR